MNFLKITVFCLFLVSRLMGFAQKSIADSTLKLVEIIVVADRLENFSSGTKIQKIDSTILDQYATGNLADLLSNESPIFIKSYGSGSLATSSFRGGSASHTAVLWNGFTLNNPMYGQLDLSLVPGILANNVSIQYGGTSALWGSGAVGGAIHLNSDVRFNTGTTVSAGASIGSFSSLQQHASIEVSKAKWVSSIKLFNHTAKNNFPYYNIFLPESPKLLQSNAELKQGGLLAENYFRINDHQKINVRFWYQFNDRNIPPTMLQSSSSANQRDESYRVTSEWQYLKDKLSLSVRTAYFDENLVYSDRVYDQVSPNNSKLFITEAESKIRLNLMHLLNAGINNTYTQAISEGYAAQHKQNRFALFGSYKFKSPNEKFQANISARQELIKNITIPFTYSGGLEMVFNKWLSARANAAKVYRIPTFNDLYWNPGGKLNLLPESGYSMEAGMRLTYQGQNKKFSLFIEPTVFNRQIDNWIIWLPELFYWSPQNLMEVWSRGVETNSGIVIEVNKLKFKIDVTTNYVVSTNEKAKTANDESIGKQLIYVPMYSGFGKFSVEYKGFVFTYHQGYYGYRYTSSDNTGFLKPYMLSNAYLSKKIKFKKYQANAFVQLNNLFNEQYQVILSRAMPLRNYQAGISIQFNQPNK